MCYPKFKSWKLSIVQPPLGQNCSKSGASSIKASPVFLLDKTNVFIQEWFFPEQYFTHQRNTSQRTSTLLAGGYHKFQMFVLLFFCQDNINWPQNFWVKSINIELKHPKSVRDMYSKNHFLTTNCFFRKFEVQIKNATQKLQSPSLLY